MIISSPDMPARIIMSKDGDRVKRFEAEFDESLWHCQHLQWSRWGERDWKSSELTIYLMKLGWHFVPQHIIQRHISNWQIVLTVKDTPLGWVKIQDTNGVNTWVWYSDQVHISSSPNFPRFCRACPPGSWSTWSSPWSAWFRIISILFFLIRKKIGNLISEHCWDGERGDGEQVVGILP